MEIIANTTDFYLEKETAAAIGKFDGIHIGHKRLLREIISRKEKGLAACVFTFDPSPAVFFGGMGGGKPSLLTTREEKRLLFEEMGVDVLIEFPLNRETAATPPSEFVRDILAGRMGVRYLAAGSDLSFGAGGAGNVALLQEACGALGFEFSVIDKVRLDGNEVSSTLVRGFVEEGKMEEAARLLGSPYMIAGRVTRGKQLGRTLGFPTLNVLPPAGKLLPPRGVYFSRVRYRGKMLRAVSNVGYKPTVTDETVMGVESYLYDFEEDIYGEPVEIYLCSFHRPERRFEGVEALRRQIGEDIAAGAAYHP